ncbi:MAG: hypothetical protein IT521_05700 [Burkholderiales bacterium]|nr:hypothetical protein [Burkholderiales bacterium]
MIKLGCVVSFVAVREFQRSISGTKRAPGTTSSAAGTTTNVRRAREWLCTGAVRNFRLATVALDRLHEVDSKRLRYDSTKPGPDGNGPLFLTPLELIDRLALLVPPNRPTAVPPVRPPWTGLFLHGSRVGLWRRFAPVASPCAMRAESLRPGSCRHAWALLPVGICEVFPLVCPRAFSLPLILCPSPQSVQTVHCPSARSANQSDRIELATNSIASIAPHLETASSEKHRADVMLHRPSKCSFPDFYPVSGPAPGRTRIRKKAHCVKPWHQTVGSAQFLLVLRLFISMQRWLHYQKIARRLVFSETRRGHAR